jgi:hypothetical protein
VRAELRRPRRGRGSYPLPMRKILFRMDAFGCALEASSACAEGQEILERYIFPALSRAGASSGSPAGAADLSVGIEPASGGFHLTAGDAAVARAERAVDLVPELIRRIDEAVVRSLRGFYAVHAGVVQIGDEAILIPGVTHAGKSSLVAALLQRGAIYFSDEYALLDAEGRVHPYPRPLLVRSGTPHQAPKLAEDYGAPTGMKPARLGWILALAYSPQEGWRLEPVPQSAGVMLLLRNTPHVLAETPEMIEAFRSAAAGARCCQGSRGDAAEAAGEILRLVRER